MVSKPIVRTLGPKAAEMAEDYLTKQGAIANIVEPSPKKVVEPFSAIDELGFHSPLENAILKIQQPKGTGEQFLKQLEKTPGVKTEELDVTGIKQFLLDKPTVTKQELLDQMATNRLKLEQKTLIREPENSIDDYQLRGGEVFDDDDYIRGLADDFHYDMKNDDILRSEERDALLKADPDRYADYQTNPYAQARLEEDVDGVLYEIAKQQANDMYYENPIRRYNDDFDYEIYGNDDMGYSFKSPSGEFLNIGGRNGTYDLGDAEAALREYHLEQGLLNLDGGGAKFEDYTLPGKYENYRELLVTLPSKQVKGSDFESSHFDEPNILAHTRLNDRIINGKKTLFVEEIQSDWHQAGRKKGYASESAPFKKEYDSKLEDWRNYLKDEGQKIGANPKYFDEVSEETLDRFATQELYNKLDDAGINRMNELFAAKNKAWQDYKTKLDTNVPDAPYKKNWHELMMKQIFNEAVKGNYDAVAFTTGKQQADRYSLSKHINELSYNPETKQLWAYKEGNSSPVISKIVEPDDLPDVIGKEATKKLLDTKMTGYTSSKGEEFAHQLTGQALDVGGEGMKGFYDKILPDYINKYGKKYGMAVRNANTKASLQGEQVHMVDLTDMAKKDIKEKGQPLFSGIGLAPAPLLFDEEDN
jgi:hypothetical protein